MNRIEKVRRKAIVREIRQQQRAEAEAAMPISKSDLKDLLEFVATKFRADGCDNSLRATKSFLIQRQLPVMQIIDWLIDEGGGCDCEVMANVEETWGERVGYLA